MLEFWKGQLDYIFFFYGLGFIFLGFVTRSFYKANYLPQIPWPYLSFFGFIHGINEWMDMVAISQGDSDTFKLIRYTVATLSFVFLFEFGFKGLVGETVFYKKWRKFILILVYVCLYSLLLWGLYKGLTPFAIASRTGFGFLGGILSAFIFFRFKKSFQGITFFVLGICFFLYALITIMGPKADFLMASFVHQDLFASIFQMPIQLLRGALALLMSILFFIIYESYLERSYAFPRRQEKTYFSFFKDPRFFIPFSIFLIMLIGAYWIQFSIDVQFSANDSAAYIKHQRFEAILMILLFVFILSYFFFNWHLERQHNLYQQQIFQTGKLAALGTLSAGVTHELNNPLTVIMGNSEMMIVQLKQMINNEDLGSHQALTPEKMLAQLEKILVACQRMSAIITHMREFSRNASSEKMMNRTLNKVTEDALIFTRKQIESKNIQIILKLDPRIPEMSMNTIKMESVVQNLLQNARDAFEDIHDDRKKEIEVQTYFDAHYYYLRVKDNASGISEENQEKVFRAFFTTKDLGKGTGLGLALVSGIVHEHKGEIDLQSREDVGSIFTIKFPRS